MYKSAYMRKKNLIGCEIFKQKRINSHLEEPAIIAKIMFVIIPRSPNRTRPGDILNP